MLERITLKDSFLPHVYVLAACFGVTLAVAGQAAPATQQETTYRVAFGTRIVLEDLTVTDAKGNPVTGLAQSAFHVSDEKHAQVILSFAESKLADSTSPVTPRMPDGTFGNYISQRVQGTVAVLLIDPIGMELADQMDLRLQILRYLKLKPDNAQVIVYRGGSRGVPVLIQSMTTDRGLLVDAINHSVPAMTRPVSIVYANAVDELQNLAEYLRMVPGKKALLWFAGSFPLYLEPDYGVAALDDAARGREMREAYRALEAARIAVYPIDVRGVVNASIASNQASNTTAAANDPSTTTQATGSDAQNTGSSYDAMDKLAAATGGRAFYSQNLIWKAMESAITSAEHAYELGYRPEGYTEDGRWHKIKITVDGPYQVHYRAGYYAAERSNNGGAKPVERARLPSIGEEADGGKPKQALAGIEAAVMKREISFSAKVLPTLGKDGKNAFEITYAVPAADLQFNTAKDGTHHSKFRMVAIAYNTSGDLMAKTIDDVETNFTETQMTLAARIGAPAKQTIQVPKGAEFLMLAVQDLTTGRVGMVQLTTKTARTQTHNK